MRVWLVIYNKDNRLINVSCFLHHFSDDIMGNCQVGYVCAILEGYD